MQKHLNRLRSLITRASKETPLPFKGHTPGKFTFPNLDTLPDEELKQLNALLPWSSWVVDGNGRRFGNKFNKLKRNEPEQIPDTRIIELNKRYGLSEKHVLEIGCFEGNHTIALGHYAKSVTAVDSRIENVVKTQVRCMMANMYPEVYCWNVEEKITSDLNLKCDVLHHVGVLYHLRDPIKHLKSVTKFVNHALMLDTHVAPENKKLKLDGNISYWEFQEHGRSNPFAGMYEHAKWIKLGDLVMLLEELGFSNVDVAELRDERNGPRVLIYAHR